MSTETLTRDVSRENVRHEKYDDRSKTNRENGKAKAFGKKRFHEIRTLLISVWEIKNPQRTEARWGFINCLIGDYANFTSFAMI